jgi:hypothetical protein
MDILIDTVYIIISNKRFLGNDVASLYLTGTEASCAVPFQESTRISMIFNAKEVLCKKLEHFVNKTDVENRLGWICGFKMRQQLKHVNVFVRGN